jgi:sugar phosphate permease
VSNQRQLKERVGFSAADAKSAHKKMLIRILPFISLLYMLSFLDRVNIGYAKNALAADLHIGAAAYGLGAGVFFIGYVIFEIPSNLIMHKVGARRWLARIMVTWGIIAACMGFIQGPVSFYVMRFVLGFAEAGLFPGVVLYLTYWYANERRSQAIGMSVYWGLALSFILGGPVSQALMSLNGHSGVKGWQWLFFVQGGLTLIVGIVTWFYLDEKPADAKWLTPAEREAIDSSVREEDQVRLHVSPLKALGNPRVLYLGAIFFCINLSLYGLTFWLPSIVGKIKGLSGFESGLVVGLPWICGLISIFVFTRLADRTGRHSKVAAGAMVTLAIGLAVSAAVSPGVGVVALCVAACGLLVALPTFWNLPTGYLTGGAAAAGIALINTIGSISGFVAPYVLGYVEKATGSIHIGLDLMALMALVGGALLLAYRRQSAATTGAADATAEQQSDPLLATDGQSTSPASS